MYTDRYFEGYADYTIHAEMLQDKVPKCLLKNIIERLTFSRIKGVSIVKVISDKP